MGNPFRTEYRELSPEEKLLVQQLKGRAEDLLVFIEQVPDARCQSLAKTNLEQSIMWAVKGVTG